MDVVSIVGRSVVAVAPAVISIAVQAVVAVVVSVGAMVGALAVRAVPPNASPALVYAFGT